MALCIRWTRTAYAYFAYLCQNSKNDHWCTNRHMSTKTVPTVYQSSKTVKQQKWPLVYQSSMDVYTESAECTKSASASSIHVRVRRIHKAQMDSSIYLYIKCSHYTAVTIITCAQWITIFSGYRACITRDCERSRCLANITLSENHQCRMPIIQSSSSSRMRVMNHNWSARKQRLHLQSAAGISRHSVLSGDRIRQFGASSESHCKDRSVSASRHFLLQAPQCPCSVRKQLRRDHWCRGRSKPGCWLSVMPPSTFDVNWLQVQLQWCPGCQCRNGGLRISGWIGQLSYLMIFSTSLSVAAFLHRAGSSMLESTGSHGKGIEWSVPEMMCMVEFNLCSKGLQCIARRLQLCPMEHRIVRRLVPLCTACANEK